MFIFQSHQLEEADDKKALERLIKDAHSKLDEIENQLASNEQGSNLRSVKELIQKKNAIDQEILLLERKVADISAMGGDMIKKRHYDSPAIKKSIDDLVARFNALQDPLDRRQRILEESLKWHQLAFDADIELNWIKEKMHVVNSQDTGRSLTEALNYQKKHDQLETEVSTHEPRVMAISHKGKDLIAANHMSSKWIRAKCDELDGSWSDLKHGVRRRKSLLDWAVKCEQFLADVGEVELWIGDKQQQVLAKTNDVDMFSAERLLGWLKSTQTDMKVYKENLERLRSKAEKIAESEGKDSVVLHRQAEVEGMFVKLEELVEEKCNEMQNLIGLCSYNQESQDLELWINDQLQTAMSEDYGQDYEHLQDLKSKFNEFQQNVKVGSERSVLCEEAANNLLMRSPPFAREILKRQEKLRSAWTLLLDYIDSRSKKLDAATHLHRFNQNVQDLHEMLNEKRVTLPVDYGRDTKQVHNLMLKHEVFQTEVSQMHEKLKRLLEEGARLKEQYPGPNAEHIDAQLAELSQSYHQLNDATVHRTNKLQAAYELQTFIARARDFVSWTSMVIAEMQDDQGTIKDLQSAEWIQSEHQRLQAEIRARDDEVTQILQIAHDMIKRHHYASKDIERRAHECDTAYSKIKREWTLRNEWLQQVVQYHGFQREASQILDTIRTKDETLNIRRPMNSVEDVASFMRQFDTFSKSLAQLESRVQFLDQLASRLINEKHMESKAVAQINENVQAAQRRLFDRMDTSRHELEDALRLARFDANVHEMSNWVDEKLAVLRKQTSDEEFRSLHLDDKLAQLRQHQAVEIQLSTNAERIQSIKDQLAVLRRHNLPENVERRAHLLLKKWDELGERSRLLSAALAEARQLFDFHQSVQRVLAWIREKQLMLQAQDVGRDFEHCTALLNKLIGKNADQSVDEATLKQVNKLGAQLVAEGTESRADIQQHLREMNDAWSHLQGRIEHYREVLQSALEVHRFNGDVDETNSRIHEKLNVLQNQDNGKDLREVEDLLRKQDKIERDMSAIHNKLNEHDEAAKLLLAKDPPLGDTIINSLKALETSWHNLAEAAHGRRLKLQQSYNLHRYFDSVKKMEQWAQQIRTKMRSYVHPKTVEDARQLLSAHTERQVEIESRQTELAALREFGQQVTSEQPEHRAEIQRAHRRLQNIEHQIRQTWEQENTTLQKMLELQTLHAQILQTESWLSSKEAFVNEYDLGESVDTVDMLIRKHLNFEKILNAQSDKIEALKAGQHILEESNNPDVERIRQQFDSVMERYAALLESCRIKGRRLDESRKLHEFIRACSELITWMNAKLQLAYDDGYIDPTNLRSKLRKHLAFDAELQQSEHRVKTIREEGEKLLKESTFETDRIQAQLSEVVEGWEELRSKSQKKTRLLQESYEAHQLSCRVGELDNWLDRVEHDLGTDDHGVDVQSADNLIEKNNLLRSEIEEQSSSHSRNRRQSGQTKEIGNYNVLNVLLNYENIDDQLRRVDAVKHRYHGLAEPCQIRAENLHESLRFFGWAANADEQLVWIGDKLPQLKSKDYGQTLHAAQSLSKKQEILQQEIDAHRAGIDDVDKQGHRMVEAGHFNASEIQSRLNELSHNFGILQQLNIERSKRLAESLRSQQYYAELSEAEQWCRERLPLVSNQESGHNQTAADAHLRRVMALEPELTKFETEVKRLHTASNAMINEHHFDSTQLTSRQASLEKLFETLQEEWHRRRSQLLDASRYHNFIRQVNDLTSWLNDKERLALREDYGVDLEECRALIEEFELAIRELSASGERLHSVINYAKQEQLLRSGHPYEASIYNAVRELEDLWRRINNTANDRQQALQDAQKIHIFDQEADEILIRLEEKEAHVVASDSEDLTNIDLATVKGLCQKHDEFLKSLHGIEKQVHELCIEADRLSALFPQTLEHLEVRRSELTEQLKDIQEAAFKYSDRLDQARNKQAYFQEWRELISWIQEMRTKIIGESLPRDLANCEALNVRHGEYHTEIQQREPQKNAFVAEGRKMIQAGNKSTLVSNSLKKDLDSCMSFGTHATRVYEENFDAQKWLHNAAVLEKWLSERENLLTEDWRQAENVDQVEDLIRQYEDFLATLDAQSPQFDALRRMTKIEESWNRMRAHEGSQMFATSSQNPSRRESSIGGENRRDTQQIKMVEKKNILQEKRQERERRKTQEITLLKRTPSQENNSLNTSGIASATLPRARNRTESIEQQALITSPGTSSEVELAKLSTSNNELGRYNKSHSGQQLHIATGGHQPIPVQSQLSAGSSSGGEQRPTSGAGSLFGTGKSRNFTTRRTQSIKKMKQWSELKSIDMNGHIDRKQELQSGGKKATIRSWKNYYVILCGQLLCFFKDEDSFFENMAAAPPVYILHARCVVFPEYAKPKHTFKLNTTDGCEYLFSCESYAKMMEWIDRINFHARLDPSHQLTSYNSITNGNSP
ncbi:Karst [Aphelenchoides bicaudatus]|nr:Karst [Aphelenchoides bicaudatus]